MCFICNCIIVISYNVLILSTLQSRVYTWDFYVSVKCIIIMSCFAGVGALSKTAYHSQCGVVFVKTGGAFSVA